MVEGSRLLRIRKVEAVDGLDQEAGQNLGGQEDLGQNPKGQDQNLDLKEGAVDLNQDQDLNQETGHLLKPIGPNLDQGQSLETDLSQDLDLDLNPTIDPDQRVGPSLETGQDQSLDQNQETIPRIVPALVQSKEKNQNLELDPNLDL